MRLITEMSPRPDNLEAPRSLAGRLAPYAWPTCKEASRLTSMGQDRFLPLGTRLRLRFHRLFCAWCARYARQLKFIQLAGGELSDHLDQVAGPSLTEDAKARLKRALRL